MTSLQQSQRNKRFRFPIGSNKETYNTSVEIENRAQFAVTVRINVIKKLVTCIKTFITQCDMKPLF